MIDAFKHRPQGGALHAGAAGQRRHRRPRGRQVYQSLLDQREERIIIINREDSLLVNALQRRAAVVLQKSLREGFGLTVAEAMWKGTPVIGGNVGGIRYQIQDGVNGFLVDSVPEAAERIVQLLKDRRPAPADGRGGPRDRAREVPDDAAAGAVPGPVRLVRGGRAGAGQSHR